MGWEDVLAGWRERVPVEEKRDKVINVVENFFQNWKWNPRGSHMIVEDERLKYYKRNINKQNKDISHDGEFHIPTRGKKVIGCYIDLILDMIEIIEAYERTR